MEAMARVCKYFVTGAVLAFCAGSAMVLSSSALMDTTKAIPAAPPAAVVEEGSQGLMLIAIFELVKTLLFLMAGAGVFHLVHRDTQVELIKLLHVFRISGDQRFVKAALLKADLMDPYKVRISIILVVYAALHATEGLGLLLRKRWAEYFTVIMTALPIPYELFLLIHRTTHSPVHDLVPEEQRVPALFTEHLFALKIAVFVINMAIVCYLATHLIRTGRARHVARLAEGGGVGVGEG